jgi:DNA-binding transcriptional regulator YiaG
MNEIGNSAVILYSRGNKQPFIVAATLFGALIAGTGGYYSQSNMELVSTWTNVPAIAISITQTTNRKTLLQNISIPEAIRQIRNKLGLKMSEVADIFGVSRQAVYLWLEGGNLKPEYSQRIWDISRIADQLQSAGIERPEHFIHRPVSADGLTLYQLLSRGGNVDTALSYLEEQSAAEQRIRDRTSVESQSTMASKRNVSSVMELSTPILDESNG